MHEYHAVEQIVRLVLETAERQNAVKVTGVTLATGKDSGFDPGSLRLYFEQIADGTVASGAQVSLRPDDSVRGLRLENIEIEDPDEPLPCCDCARKKTAKKA